VSRACGSWRPATKASQEQDWKPSVSTARIASSTGRATWIHPTTLGSLFEAYTGPSPYGQFFRKEVKYFGAGIHFTLTIHDQQYDVIVAGMGAMGARRSTLARLGPRGKRRRVLGIDRLLAAARPGSSHGRTRIICEAYSSIRRTCRSSGAFDSASSSTRWAVRCTRRRAAPR
jgi:hypothetical protein